MDRGHCKEGHVSMGPEEPWASERMLSCGFCFLVCSNPGVPEE